MAIPVIPITKEWSDITALLDGIQLIQNTSKKSTRLEIASVASGSPDPNMAYITINAFEKHDVSQRENNLIFCRLVGGDVGEIMNLGVQNFISGRGGTGGTGGTGVTTFNTRNGEVIPIYGDYDTSLIDHLGVDLETTIESITQAILDLITNGVPIPIATSIILGGVRIADYSALKIDPITGVAEVKLGNYGNSGLTLYGDGLGIIDSYGLGDIGGYTSVLSSVYAGQGIAHSYGVRKLGSASPHEQYAEDQGTKTKNEIYWSFTEAGLFMVAVSHIVDEFNPNHIIDNPTYFIDISNRALYEKIISDEVLIATKSNYQGHLLSVRRLTATRNMAINVPLVMDGTVVSYPTTDNSITKPTADTFVLKAGKNYKVSATNLYVQTSGTQSSFSITLQHSPTGVVGTWVSHSISRNITIKTNDETTDPSMIFKVYSSEITTPEMHFRFLPSALVGGINYSVGLEIEEV